MYNSSSDSQFSPARLRAMRCSRASCRSAVSAGSRTVAVVGKQPRLHAGDGVPDHGPCIAGFASGLHTIGQPRQDEAARQCPGALEKTAARDGMGQPGGMSIGHGHRDRWLNLGSGFAHRLANGSERRENAPGNTGHPSATRGDPASAGCDPGHRRCKKVGIFIGLADVYLEHHELTMQAGPEIGVRIEKQVESLAPHAPVTADHDKHETVRAPGEINGCATIGGRIPCRIVVPAPGWQGCRFAGQDLRRRNQQPCAEEQRDCVPPWPQARLEWKHGATLDQPLANRKIVRRPP